ncbi:potassium transporter Kef [Agromyces sp. PvR057]|uniref:potassium transporter Kef n=1 Tax=Agromyces sp. PvR057 TaxID=3156403 RepID=UPI003399E248
MIRVAGTAANSPLAAVPLETALSDAAAHCPDLDLALAAANVGRSGGDPLRFAVTLGAGFAELEAAPSRADALDLVAVAGWRAGVLGLRDDALRRLETIRSDERMRPAAAAVLGLDTDEVDGFIERQARDRYWWPGRDRLRGYVCSAGGFAGLGGAWIAPPDGWCALAEPGAFGVHAAGDWWRLDADVWGARLIRLAEAPEASATADPCVSIVCRPDTHLAWLHVRDAG